MGLVFDQISSDASKLLTQKHSKKNTEASVQPKLEVGDPDSKMEHEADEVADIVMRMPKSAPPMSPPDDEEEGDIQMKRFSNTMEVNMKPVESDGNNSVSAPDSVTQTLHRNQSVGKPLSEKTQHEMSSKIGHDFSLVNIHTGSEAIQMNQELSSRAFTQGNDIYFNSEEYSPETSAGMRLLAHELTHVVQQEGNGASLIQRDGNPNTMQRPIRRIDPQRVRSDHLRQLEENARSSMISIMRNWDRGELIFNFRWSNGTVVNDRVPTWITGGTYVTRGLGLEIVMNQLIDLGSHFIISKLYALRRVTRTSPNTSSDIDHEIQDWQRVVVMAQRASTESEMSDAYQWFMIKNNEVVDIIHRHYPEVEQEESTPSHDLTAAQIAEINRLVERMPYGELERGYLELKDWLSDQTGLGFIKSAIENGDTVVDAAYTSGVRIASERISDYTHNSLKLMSKLIGNMGEIDKVFLLATASERVQAEEDKELIKGFISVWSQNGWNSMMSFYRSARGQNQPAYSSVSEEYFVTLDAQNQITIALNVAQVLRMDDRINFRVIGASISETLGIIGEVAWWVTEKAFLSRIPGWALLKLSVTSAADVASLIYDMASESD